MNDLIIDDEVIEEMNNLITDEEIKKKVGGLTTKYYERALEYGERAWRVKGKKKEIIVWDAGNGWYEEMKK